MTRRKKFKSIEGIVRPNHNVVPAGVNAARRPCHKRPDTAPKPYPRWAAADSCFNGCICRCGLAERVRRRNGNLDRRSSILLNGNLALAPCPQMAVEADLWRHYVNPSDRPPANVGMIFSSPSVHFASLLASSLLFSVIGGAVV